jgi:hypothetical protein
MAIPKDQNGADRTSLCHPRESHFEAHFPAQDCPTLEWGFHWEEGGWLLMAMVYHVFTGLFIQEDGIFHFLL